ncbi:MAG: SGNH/GDSL hydrolase family protein [Phycisphaerae bacterium]|nr:SGNH/GDSL hydrolase family protein [Phycisphaerae bacterium]
MSRRRRSSRPKDEAVPAPKKTVRRKLLLAAVSLLTSLLCAEACVKILFLDEVDTELMMRRLKAGSMKDLKQPSDDPGLVFECKPSLRRQGHGTLYITDSEGCRVSGHPTSASADGVRIAVLGDSSSFGWGVAYDDSYPEVFRRRMAKLTGTSISLKNFSVPAYNAAQEAVMFSKRIVPYSPDLLILHHDHNDSGAIPHLKALPDGLHPTYGDNPLRSGLVKLVLRRLKQREEKSQRRHHRDTCEYVGPFIASGPLYDEHLDARRQVADGCRAVGLPCVVVIFNPYVVRQDDYSHSPDYLRLHKALDDRLSEMGFHVLDLYPFYQSKMWEAGWQDLRQWWVSKTEPIDPHPNAAGHRYIADCLVEYMKTRPELMAVFAQHKPGR